MLLFALPAGAWVDRLARRPVRITADLASAAAIGAVPLADQLGLLQLEHLYLATFAVGTMTVFARLSGSSLLPSLVGRRNLLAANSALLVSFSLAQICGPALAGVLVQLFRPPIVLLLDAGSFLISAVCFSLLAEPPREAHATPKTGLVQEILEGLRFLRQHVILFRLTVGIGLANLAWFAVQGVLVPYGTRDLGLTPAMLGLAVAVMGPASLIGSVLAARFAYRFGLGRTLIASLSGELLSRIVLLAAGGPPLVAAMVVGSAHAIFGFIAPLWDVNANSLRQTVTPERLLGRVTAASSFVGLGTGPIGAVLGGFLGDIAGARTTVIATAFITLLAVVLLIASPVARLRSAEHASSESAA